MEGKVWHLKLLQRSIYFVALLLLVLILLVQSYRCMVLFFADPTYFSQSIVNQNKVEFPSFTVCPGSGGYKEALLQVITATV